MMIFKKFNITLLLLLLGCFYAINGHAKRTTITFIHTDHLGSPIAATNEDGSVKWREEYQPFGKQLTNQDSENNVGFTSHKEDKDLGLTYMQARWYHPEAARFMGLDPLLYRDVHSFNRYVYGNNNPYKYVDPDGKASKLKDLKVALKEVHKILGGKLRKGKKGKFGSSQHGDSRKGYRLDNEGHPNAEPGTPDADGPHINWWDYTDMKAKTAKKLGKLNEVKGAVRVGDTLKKGTATIVGGVVTGLEFIEEKMPRTNQWLEFLSDPVGFVSQQPEENPLELERNIY